VFIQHKFQRLNTNVHWCIGIGRAIQQGVLNSQNHIGAGAKCHQFCHGHAARRQGKFPVRSRDHSGQFVPIFLPDQTKRCVLVLVTGAVFEGGIRARDAQIIVQTRRRRGGRLGLFALSFAAQRDGQCRVALTVVLRRLGRFGGFACRLTHQAGER